MAESARRRLLPWGSVLTISALALVLLREFPDDPETDWLLPPLNLWAAFLIVVAVFLIERRLNRYWWALTAAVLLIWHPSFQRQFVQASNPALLAEALVLAALACTLLAWDLTFLPEFAWWSWIVANLGLCACIALAWLTQPPAGLRAAVLAGAGMAAAFVLARWRRRRQLAGAPSCYHVTAAAVTALLAPIGGFLLVPRIGRVAGWLHNASATSGQGPFALLAAAVQAPRDQLWREFTRTELDLWCWPSLWLVLPVLTWAVWRTVRRGWKQWRRGQAPLPWLLTLYTLLTFLGVGLLPPSDPRLAIIALTVLVVVLGVFWIADLFRGAVEHLVLQPPEEGRDDAATRRRGD